MEINIRAGMRVLYKQSSSNWMIGTIHKGTAEVNEQGIWIPIVPLDTEDELHYAEINQIFFEVHPVEDWMKQYHNLMTKEEYITFIKSDDFEHSIEQAWVSDGEYYYYPVSKYSTTWLSKQPFDYIVRDAV